jgi:hypothetical protein
VHDRLLDEEHLAPFKTLILPNIAALSLKQCQQLTAFVERGGSIVATFETSLYDEWGARRHNFGLSHLFGASFDGRFEGPMHNSYLSLERDPATGHFHPLLAGLEDATRIINGVNRVVVQPLNGGISSPLTVVPSYPDLPMEEVFVRPFTSRDAGVFLREIGAGRVVFFPWDIDRTFWEVLAVDHAKLLRNAVLWANRGSLPVSVRGPGVLDVSIWTQKKSMTVHLVNLTNPMMMKGPVREIIPVSSQTVRIEIPAGKPISAPRLLVSKAKPAFSVLNGKLELEVPSIGLHEVIALDFTG